MKISEVRIKQIEGEGALLGYATVTFEECFVVHNIKVMDGEEGRFIAMPRRKTAAGVFKDIAHPITTQFRHDLQDAVLDAYIKEVGIETVAVS